MLEICTPTAQVVTFTEFSTFTLLVDNCQVILTIEHELYMDLGTP